jgi:hypothetical protein
MWQWYHCPLPLGFFNRLSSEQYLERYYDLLEEQFILKCYGELSLFEQQCLTAEDRVWWIQRINKKNEEERKEFDKARSR